MDYKNMTPDEILRLASPTTELERQLLEIMADYQESDAVREAAGFEIADLETKVALRDNQIAIVQKERDELAARCKRLRSALIRRQG